jgi:hypothetical protein
MGWEICEKLYSLLGKSDNRNDRRNKISFPCHGETDNFFYTSDSQYVLDIFCSEFNQDKYHHQGMLAEIA